MNTGHWTLDELAILQEAGNSIHTREIASSLDRSICAIRRKRRMLGLTPDASIFNRQYRIDDNAFDTWSEEVVYWMGVIAADGCLRQSTKRVNAVVLQLAEKDVDHLMRLQDFTQSEHPVTVNHGKATFVFSSTALYQRLLNIGITPNKTATLQFPSIIPEAIKHHFIRGYFDGDGSVGKGRDGCPFFSLLGTETFLQGVADVLPVNATVRKRADCNIYRIQLWGENARQSLRWMYRDATVFLPRKREKAKDYLP
jgi:hypothetical protein